MERGEGGYNPDIELVAKSSHGVESGGEQEFAREEYDSGDKVRALDENKEQAVEWTVVNYEQPNKLLHLKRDLPNGDVRMRVIHIDRLRDEQGGENGEQRAA